MPDAFGLAAIVTKLALYLGVLTSAGTVMATLLFRLVRTRGLALVFAICGSWDCRGDPRLLTAAGPILRAM